MILGFVNLEGYFGRFSQFFDQEVRNCTLFLKKLTFEMKNDQKIVLKF